MHVAKWGNSLAVRIPRALAEELGLKEGDEVELSKAGDKAIAIEKTNPRAQALQRMADRGWSLPPDYQFDREDANER